MPRHLRDDPFDDTRLGWLRTKRNEEVKVKDDNKLEYDPEVIY